MDMPLRFQHSAFGAFSSWGQTDNSSTPRPPVPKGVAEIFNQHSGPGGCHLCKYRRKAPQDQARAWRVLRPSLVLSICRITVELVMLSSNVRIRLRIGRVMIVQQSRNSTTEAFQDPRIPVLPLAVGNPARGRGNCGARPPIR